MAFVYSCCFWFSLRLGGILIGIYSILQALAVLIVLCLGYTHSEKCITMITELTDDMVLIFTKDYIENFKSDPERYFKLGIGISSVYVIVCLMFIYGAYMCNNMLMIPYILIELVYLVMLSLTVAIALLVLKQNSMDIGLLIGASVAAGFFLLGHFYLWVCTANLPILVNEIEHDEQAATIERLQQLLRANNQKTNIDNIPLAADYVNTLRSDLFVVPESANGNFDNLRSRVKATDPYKNAYFIQR